MGEFPNHQGDANPYLTSQTAYDLAAFCTGVPGAPRVEIMSGAPFACAILSEFAPTINHLVASHVEESNFVEPSKSKQLGDEDVTRDRRKGMAAALDILASLVPLGLQGNIKTRNPESALSFSTRPPDVIEEIKERCVNNFRAPA